MRPIISRIPCLSTAGVPEGNRYDLPVTITVNGEASELPEGGTIADLIRARGTEPPYAVEVNRIVVPRKDHEDRTLSDGDDVNVVTLVGGG